VKDDSIENENKYKLLRLLTHFEEGVSAEGGKDDQVELIEIKSSQDIGLFNDQSQKILLRVLLSNQSGC
jgi:hypothetical protein